MDLYKHVHWNPYLRMLWNLWIIALHNKLNLWNTFNASMVWHIFEITHNTKCGSQDIRIFNTGTILQVKGPGKTWLTTIHIYPTQAPFAGIKSWLPVFRQMWLSVFRSVFWSMQQKHSVFRSVFLIYPMKAQVTEKVAH